ncbi:MAG: DUF4232 domain-containing protein [Streptosporangiaceae bacterium]
MGVRIPAGWRARTRKAGLSLSNVLAATAAAAVVATGCAASGTAPAPPPSPSVTGTPGTSGASGGNAAGVAGSGSATSRQECAAADLTVTTGATVAAAGHSSLVLLFTNSGSASCFVQGYPGVAVQLGGGRVYNAVRAMTGYMGGDAGPSPARVQLAPGVTASALIEWLHFPRDGSASVTAADCAGHGAVRLLVTAPDRTAPATLAPPAPVSPVCWGFEVHPIVAGSAGQYPGTH